MGMRDRDPSLRGAPRGWFSEETYDKQCKLRDYYNKRRNDYANIIEEKLMPDWFYLTYCDESEKHREFANNKCSHLLSHRTVITCKYCQSDFKTFDTREVRCSLYYTLSKHNLEKYNAEEIKK